MQKRVIVLSILLFLSAFVSISLISAYTTNYSCNIVPSANCNSSVNGNIIIGLSASSNAHAEFPYQSYPYALCCYFGAGNTTCSSLMNSVYGSPVPKNEILRLTASTNAHSESPAPPVNYPVPVCYWADSNHPLECVSTTSGCDSNYFIPMVNLSNYTNAHIGTGAGFNTEICCKLAGLLYGQLNCKLNSATWTYSSAMQGVQVGLNVTGTNCAGATINFNITDSNGNKASNFPGDVSFPISGGNSISATWTAEYHTGQPNNYKFKATSALSNSVLFSGSPNATLSTSQQPVGFCNAINTCGDYVNQTTCSSDSSLCNVANNVPTCSQNGGVCKDPKAYSYGCGWNTTSNLCNFINVYQANGVIKCGNGYTLCTNQTTSSNYCYPGNTCPNSEIPLSNGNGVCDAGEGCSSNDCQNGNPVDNCGLNNDGSLCQAGACYKANSNPVNITQCSNGYTLCYNQPKGLTYCYPNDVCPTGDSAPINSCASANTTNGNNGNPSSCLGDSVCAKTNGINGYCASPTASVGKCVYSFINTGDTCADGFLTYKWTATWTGNGNKPANCNNGQSVIECPAQIPLPLFTALNAIIAIAAIILIYVIIVLVKRSKKHTTHSRRKSHRRK
jgi:hypothetical protein